MPRVAIPLEEFSSEMATTRRLLERVPTEKGRWKPHEKSFALGHLAQLLSWMPGWITNALTETSLDLAKGGQYSLEKTESLLAQFDTNVREARAAIEASPSTTPPGDLAIDDWIWLPWDASIPLTGPCSRCGTSRVRRHRAAPALGSHDGGSRADVQLSVKALPSR